MKIINRPWLTAILVPLAFVLGLFSSQAGARASLSDLQRQIDELEAKFENLANNPCPPGEAIIAIDDNGMPTCVSFRGASLAEFSFNFFNGQTHPEACTAWQAFIQQAVTVAGQSLVVSGSLGQEFRCEDPFLTEQILDALEAARLGPRGTQTSFVCSGFNWTVNNSCGGGASFPTTPSLTVNPASDPVPLECQCPAANQNINIIRPCIDNLNWGGIGTNTCGAPSQTMSVDVFGF